MGKLPIEGRYAHEIIDALNWVNDVINYDDYSLEEKVTLIRNYWANNVLHILAKVPS